ncbi:MAG: DNA repair protein RecN [Sphingobacteriales bacterium]|nr:DNA repair protein RecN [Sphingobacteriales bacterium]OJY84413.1 MAG: DNA repair protein RecN [Sphingobacteriales bacterium 44-15]
MLQKLFIRHYAIIDSIDISFSEKLNIITGETGAGKSILVGAMGLILGERADSNVLFDSDSKCIVEGVFTTDKRKDIQKFIAENDLDAADEIIIRREVSANGKSRAFVNDTPVTLVQLKQLASMLVDLHQQFDTLELGDSDFQRDIIDALAGHPETLAGYQRIYARYIQTEKQLSLARQQQASAQKELDYNRFLFSELEDAALKENELEDIEAELKILNNAELIKASLGKVQFTLQEGDQPVVQQLKALANQLQSAEQYHAGIPALIQRLQSAHIELRDIADEAEQINEALEFDAARIQLLNERLDTGYKLLKKHGVQTTAELLSIKGNLEQQLTQILHLDEAISRLEKEAAAQLKEVTALAATLTAGRAKQIAPLEKKTEKLLAQVGMPNARLKVSLSASALGPYGADSIEFLFDANKSNRFESLKKVASGGELSRLMLCIKSLVAASVELPTLIFDEIDSGISGEAAKQVGIIMKALGRSHQVIAITHQPQIAAKADMHFFVYKQERNGKIHTQIRQLNDEERVDAIARMLGGEKPTPVVMNNAREMITT